MWLPGLHYLFIHPEHEISRMSHLNESLLLT